jgi:transcriptional regulator with XRE-family HTH domain
MTDKTEKIQLGQRLKENREYRGFSQEDVAKFLGIPRSAISLMETGDRNVDAIEIKKLADLYQCSTALLLGTAQPPKNPPTLVARLAKTASDLSEEDVAEVLRFAQYMKTRKKPKA